MSGLSAHPAIDIEQCHASAREDGPAIEEQRKLTSRAAQDIARSGFPRHFLAEQWGGNAGTFTELLSAGARLAESSASAAWCAVLYAAHGRLASYLPQAGQKELWHTSPDLRIAASVVPPQGTAQRENDGWLLNGRWNYASGVDHADWVLLASWTQADDGTREHRIFAVPRQEIEVLDTWRVLGLRGTGSNSVTAGDVFVPGDCTMTLRDLQQPQNNGARCHDVPFLLVAALMFATPVVGAARAALHEWLTSVAGKRRPNGRIVGDTSKGRETFALASAEVQAAWSLLEGAARRADHGVITPLTVAENQRDASAAVRFCAQAVERLFTTAGAGGLAEGNRLQQCWRDVTAMASHATLDFDVAADAYTQAAIEAAGRGSG